MSKQKAGRSGGKANKSGPTPSAKRSKAPKGNAPGSRHSQAIASAAANPSGPRDKRLGSKKPIPLTKTEAKPKEQPKFFSPRSELKDIEQDDRLSDLMDRVDAGDKLGADDQQYFEQRMSRHRALCELLGITDEADKESDANEDDSDLLSKLNTNHLDDYK